MDYQKHYNLLISRARNRILEGYVERHHVLPKCLGGSDDKTNIVQLTPEEHFVAHALLVKIYPEERNLILAVQKMCRGHKGSRKNKMYGWLKKRFAARMRELSSGIGNSQFGTRWVNDGSKSFKLKKDEVLPLGCFEGRIKLPKKSRAKYTKEERNVIFAKNVSSHKRRICTDAQISDALSRTTNISDAMILCGYKPSFGYTRNRFIALLSSPASTRTLTM